MPVDPNEDTNQEENTSPWDSDLATAFEDEDLRTKVSEFLGEKVQPYVTKIEQDSKPNRDAQRLWEGFNESPVDTYIAVSREIYGPEVADKVAAILQGGDAPVEESPATDTTEETQETEEETPTTKLSFDDLPPEVKEVVAQTQAAKQKEAYYGEIDRVTAEHADSLPKGEDDKPQLNVDLFHPFVVAADGDFDKAWDAYEAFQSQAKETFGIQVPAVDEDGKPVPPTTLDSQTRDSSATPPQEVKYESLDEAMDAFFDEQKSPPPTVGAA